MPSRPISLIALECILKYMEPDKRFRTAQHCAAIRKTEKRVPLHINFLQLADFDITINQVTYSLDILIKCDHFTNCPSYASFVNEIRDDLDQYCLPITPTDLEITPGDLIFNTELPNFDNQRRDIIAARQNQLNSMKLNLQRHRKRGSQGMHQVVTGNSVRELQAKIKELEENLEDFHFQREVVRNPCSNLLQLSIFKHWRNPNQCLVQQGVYNMKLGKAMKQLTTFLFSGRRLPIQVRKLKLVQTIKVLRLPEDMKLHVKELDIEGNADKLCEGIQPILSEDCLPLDLVSVMFNQREQFTPHEIIKKAKKVHISCGLTTQIDHTIFSELECLELIMLREFIAAEYFQLVQVWLNTQKRVGTRYSFRVNSESRRILDRMRTDFNGWPLNAETFNGVVIPMGDGIAAKIHVSYQRSSLVLEVVAE